MICKKKNQNKPSDKSLHAKFRTFHLLRPNVQILWGKEELGGDGVPGASAARAKLLTYCIWWGWLNLTLDYAPRREEQTEIEVVWASWIKTEGCCCRPFDLCPRGMAKERYGRKDWSTGFRKRHQRLSIWRPQTTSFIQVNVQTTSHNLADVLDPHHFGGKHMWNMEGTLIKPVQKPNNSVHPRV